MWARRLAFATVVEMSPVETPGPGTDETFAKIRALRKEHDGHVVHDPKCAFCCGDIT